MGERSFSKSWGLRASVPFFPLPLPRHSFLLLSSQLFSTNSRGNACYAGYRLVEEHFWVFLVRPFFFFSTLSDIFKICILFVCTPYVNFMNNLIYCNNSMICIACEIKICSHVDYQVFFAVNRNSDSRYCG